MTTKMSIVSRKAGVWQTTLTANVGGFLAKLPR